ncbi:amino acid transporter, putative [Entamoeba histolytica HM-1:IMSS-A]|uniref:Amino acid transporter, putative n=1 Tax=Entamoeba histolytica HM-1:IMSS-A TaxID=885318 RepID=N9TDA0_ENTH1|nr:amino acid transporter, putative [Entamoeba histolytica HM-1:IMSS-A]
MEKIQKGYSFIASIGIIINYSIGVGVFGLPFSFYSGGLPLSMILTSVMLLLTLITSMYTIEAMTRTCKRKTNSDELDQEIYDFTLISGMWHSKQGKILTSILIIVVNYCYLWGYVATGSNTLMTMYWLFKNQPQMCDTQTWNSQCNLSYYICVAVFMVLTVPLAYVNLSQQGFLQLFMAFYRIIMFSILLITITIQLFHGPVQLGNHKIDTAWTNEWKWGNFGILFTHISVAFSLQSCLPDALQPVRNKKQVGLVTIIGSLISGIIYILVGALCASVFTASSTNPVTINYEYYTGRNGGFGIGNPTVIGYIIRYAILIFPIVNILNEYPLVCYTLATNISSTLPKSYGGKWRKYAIISCAVFPPFALACLVGSVKTIASLTGIVAFILSYVFPCAFVLASRRISVARNGIEALKNRFYSWYSTTTIVVIVFVICSILSIISTTFVLYNVFKSLV